MVGDVDTSVAPLGMACLQRAGAVYTGFRGGAAILVAISLMAIGVESVSDCLFDCVRLFLGASVSPGKLAGRVFLALAQPIPELGLRADDRVLAAWE